MDKILKSIMDDFANQGIVFSNEQDFQFEMALALSKNKNIKQVKLEMLSLEFNWNEVAEIAITKGQISEDKKEYHDLFVEFVDGTCAVVELKYKTPDKICLYETKNGRVITMKQGAQDENAYAFIEDIRRLEHINERYFPNDKKIDKAYAVFLTNFKKYRFGFDGYIWGNYSVEENKILKGTLYFGKDGLEHRGRKAIKLNGLYKIHWNDYPLCNYQDYKDLMKSHCPGFSYTIVEVKTKAE